jgi:hypothetical protein
MSPLNPDLPAESVPARIVASVSRSREVVIFAAGVVVGVVAVLLGSLT